MLETGAAKCLKITDFSVGPAAACTAPSGDSSEDAGGRSTSTDMGESETDSRDMGSSIIITVSKPEETRQRISDLFTFKSELYGPDSH